MTHELRVEIDRLVCIGSGTCERLAPSAFKVDKDGRAVVLDPTTVDEERLRAAERVCPSGAIRVVEEQGRTSPAEQGPTRPRA